MDSVPRFTVVRFHGHQPISVYEGTRNQVFIWLLMNPGIVDPDHAVYDRETLVTERVDFFKEMIHEELSGKRPEIDPVIAYTDGVEKIIPIKGEIMENTWDLILQAIEITRCHPEKSVEELFAMFPAQPNGKPEKRDLNHAHIDNIKFSVMEDIHSLVKQAAELGQSNTDMDLSESILGYTSEIIELVSGVSSQAKTQMSKNQKHFHDMTFRRVKEAIHKVAFEGLGFSDDRIINVAEVYAKKIVSDVFGGGMPGVHETESEFVEKYYEMDPETEDLLDNGTLVIPGMKVLIESPSGRQTIYDGMTEDEIAEARVTNRWATVVSSKVHRGGDLSFIALYDDGVKRKVVEDVQAAWLVKKDSIPRIDSLMDKDGHIIESLPTAQMVSYLEERIKSAPGWFDVNGGRVQTGIDGDVVPLAEYLVSVGIESTATIYKVTLRPEGTVVYEGTKNMVRFCLEARDDAGRSNLLVGEVGGKVSVSAVEFIQEFNAQEGDG